MASTDFQTLHARACVAYLRSLRLGALGALAVLSPLLWFQGAVPLLPETIAWLLGLAAATLAALALAYGVLECRWDARARHPGQTRFAFSRSAVRHDVIAGLLGAWGIVSLFPCAAALGGPLPAHLLAALSPLAVGLIAVRVLLEVLHPSARRSHGRTSALRAWAARLGVR